MITADIRFEPERGVSEALAQAKLAGLRNGGEHILKLARDRVPIEEGTLERSGLVTDDGRDMVAVSFDTPYAVRQHEDLTARHAQGRQAKYLETAAADGRVVTVKILQAALLQAARS